MRYTVCPNCDCCFEVNPTEPLEDQTAELVQTIHDLNTELYRAHHALQRISRMRPGLGAAPTMAAIARRLVAPSVSTERLKSRKRRGHPWEASRLPDLSDFEELS